MCVRKHLVAIHSPAHLPLRLRGFYQSHLQFLHGLADFDFCLVRLSKSSLDDSWVNPGISHYQSPSQVPPIRWEYSVEILTRGAKAIVAQNGWKMWGSNVRYLVSGGREVRRDVVIHLMYVSFLVCLGIAIDDSCSDLWWHRCG